MSLEDQVALITGSSRGLGLAIAKALHKAGAKVIINYISPPTSQATADQVAKDLSPNAIAIRADITDPIQVTRLFTQAQSHFNAPITIIVNNALTSNFTFNGPNRKPLDQLTTSDFTSHFNTTIHGALNTTQAALEGFSTHGAGRIINIGTNLLHNPVVPYHDYVSSKAALLGFTRTTAAELGPRNVTVNMVSAGLLRVTDASRETPEDVFEQVRQVTPLRRVMTPEDVAGVVVFLASEGAGGITGQEIVVDGGLCMK